MPSEPLAEHVRRLVQSRPGWWEIDGSRVCLFDVEAELSALHWAFFDEVGMSAAHFLYLAGLRAAVALTSTLKRSDLSGGFLEAGLRLLSERGYGLFRLVHFEDSDDIIAVEASATLEAWAYLKHQDRAHSPVCNYTRGLLAGLACMATEPAGTPSPNIVCWEIDCVACGATCRFVIGSAETLARRGYRNPDEQRSPRWALEVLNTELKVSTDQLKEAQSRLIERQQAYEHLLDNMLDPLLVLNRARKILFTNLRFHEITGLTQEQTSRFNALELIHVDDRPRVDEAFDDLIDDVRPAMTISFRVQRRDGEVVLECSARRIMTMGEVAVEAICRDVTERERTRVALEAANRKLVMKQREADNDLRLAKRVHESLLPKPIANEWINVDVKYVPVDRVGGDYCHIATVDSRYIVITLCDVSGHGVAAALMASRVNSHLSEQELIDPDPWAITRDMNEFLCRNFGDTGMFVTFLAVTIDLKTLTARICGAGHPGPIIWRKETGETSSLRSQHLPIGILDDFQRTPHFATIELSPGDRLILYTDGIIDATDRKGRPLRPAGMEELVHGAGDVPLFELADWLLGEVAVEGKVRAHDDMTLMLIEVLKPLKSRSEYSVGTI